MLSIKLIVSTSLIFLFLTEDCLAQQDTTASERSGSDTVFIMEKSPWGAVIRSAVVPGWGQIYNESYIKAGIFWGIGAWLVYNWIINNDDYKYYQELYNRENLSVYRQYRTLYRDQRDLFSIYIVLTYVLNLVDAYVDAHLFDFTVEEDFLTRMPRLNLKLKLF